MSTYLEDFTYNLLHNEKREIVKNGVEYDLTELVKNMIELEKEPVKIRMDLIAECQKLRFRYSEDLKRIIKNSRHKFGKRKH